MTDTKYVTVPREPTQAQLDAMLAAAEALLISPTKKSMGSKESAHEMNAATYRAALAAAPPAASGRAKVTAAERLKKHDSLFARCINANMDARAALRKCVFPEVSTLDVLDRAVKRELVR